MATDDTANDSTKPTPEDVEATNSTPSPDPAPKSEDVDATVKAAVVTTKSTDAEQTVKIEKATEKAPAAVAAPAAAEAKPAGSRGPWFAAAAAGVAAVALGTALAVFVVLWAQRGEKIDDTKEATAAACDFVRTVSVFDGTGQLEPYFTEVEAKTTGELQTNFRAGADGLRAAMVEIGAKSTIEDLECSPLSSTEDQVMVQGTWIQYQGNKLSTETRPMIFPVKITVDRVDDKWLVSMMKSPILDRLGMGSPLGSVAPTDPGTQVPAPAPAPGN
ncbi:hypothetical protein ACFWUP_22290 [Nocardia sp. NPDC058658]|uniref:hypothetical protein n=1 Tax=Nocardia sp. NPDC058658 TaxID=3346580 RepID=UPI0036515BE2